MHFKESQPAQNMENSKDFRLLHLPVEGSHIKCLSDIQYFVTSPIWQSNIGSQKMRNIQILSVVLVVKSNQQPSLQSFSLGT